MCTDRPFIRGLTEWAGGKARQRQSGSKVPWLETRHADMLWFRYIPKLYITKCWSPFGGFGSTVCWGELVPFLLHARYDLLRVLYRAWGFFVISRDWWFEGRKTRGPGRRGRRTRRTLSRSRAMWFELEQCSADEQVDDMNVSPAPFWLMPCLIHGMHSRRKQRSVIDQRVVMQGSFNVCLS